MGLPVYRISLIIYTCKAQLSVLLKNFVFLIHFICLKNREREAEISSTGSLCKCSQKPELGQAVARGWDSTQGFHVGSRNPLLEPLPAASKDVN